MSRSLFAAYAQAVQSAPLRLELLERLLDYWAMLGSGSQEFREFCRGRGIFP